jgi:hypothetical protein
MTKEELIEGLRNCRDASRCEDFYSEEPHVLADQLLLDFINDPEVQKTFDSIRKWYI